MQYAKLTKTSIALWPLLFILMVLLTLSGCGTVTIKDETIWALKPRPMGAFEAHTLKPDQKELTQDQWDAISTGKLCMSIDSLGNFKAIQEQLCSYHPSECTYDDQQRLNLFFTRARKLAKKAKALQ